MPAIPEASSDLSCHAVLASSSARNVNLAVSFMVAQQMSTAMTMPAQRALTAASQATRTAVSTGTPRLAARRALRIVIPRSQAARKGLGTVSSLMQAMPASWV